VIQHSALSDNEQGVRVGGDRFVGVFDTLVEKNFISTTGGSAISTDRTQDQLYVIGNRISLPPGATGIDAGYGSIYIERNWITGGDFGMYFAKVNAAAVRNHVSNALIDGIYAEFGDLLVGNVTKGNGDDGIELDFGTVTRNTIGQRQPVAVPERVLQVAAIASQATRPVQA
jgi:hypothetical protein